MKTILITDSLFIFAEHEKMLKDAGYEIERLDKPHATEEELVQEVKGKVGYILGGIEQITDKVIDAADELKAIAFTGADWRYFVPGHERATQRGIAIASTPGANRFAVSEYTVALILGMTRNIFELGRTGVKKFQTTNSIQGATVGIIGMGNIGSQVVRILHTMGPKEILYYSREQKPEVEKETGAKFVDLDTLLTQSDIVSLHASKEIGLGFIGKEQLSKMKDGALLINCGFTEGINKDALFEELKSGRLRAAQDDPADERFNSLPLSVWFCSNGHTAYNTHQANKTASDMATQSLLNLLSTGKDQYKVN
jgi:phosphoglycerate dehydrogenase-like enzyme